MSEARTDLRTRWKWPEAARERGLSLSRETTLLPLLRLQPSCALPHRSAPRCLSSLPAWPTRGCILQHSRDLDLLFALCVCLPMARYAENTGGTQAGCQLFSKSFTNLHTPSWNEGRSHFPHLHQAGLIPALPKKH